MYFASSTRVWETVKTVKEICVRGYTPLKRGVNERGQNRTRRWMTSASFLRAGVNEMRPNWERSRTGLSALRLRRADTLSNRVVKLDARQNEILRYSRLEICATSL